MYSLIVFRSLAISTQLVCLEEIVLYFRVRVDLIEESVEIWLSIELVVVTSLLVNGFGLALRLKDGAIFYQKSSFSRLYASNLRSNAYSAKE